MLNQNTLKYTSISLSFLIFYLFEKNIFDYFFNKNGIYSYVLCIFIKIFFNILQTFSLVYTNFQFPATKLVYDLFSYRRNNSLCNSLIYNTYILENKGNFYLDNSFIFNQIFKDKTVDVKYQTYFGILNNENVNLIVFFQNKADTNLFVMSYNAFKSLILIQSQKYESVLNSNFLNYYFQNISNFYEKIQYTGQYVKESKTVLSENNFLNNFYKIILNTNTSISNLNYFFLQDTISFNSNKFSFLGIDEYIFNEYIKNVGYTYYVLSNDNDYNIYFDGKYFKKIPSYTKYLYRNVFKFKISNGLLENFQIPSITTIYIYTSEIENFIKKL